MPHADIGVVGLGVMGANLALNLLDHGHQVCVYNRTTAITRDFLERNGGSGRLRGADTPQQLVEHLGSPRVLLLMVKAGQAVDRVLEQFLPLLHPGDIVIDGGNSLYSDSTRRWRQLAEDGIHFVGMGISGGEEGARHGPSLMPGGSAAAWPHISPMFQAIAARAGDAPCCRWLGEGGAGHYVKMVHNGIEYGDMQLIAEACLLMQHALGMDFDAMADTFSHWNEGKLESYLIEITAAVLRQRDKDGTHLVASILDRAGQKGTGLWTVRDALDRGTPLTLISEALHARMLSGRKEERVAAADRIGGVGDPVPPGERASYLDALRDGLYGAKLVSYAQGFMLLQAASAEYGWQLPFGDIALLWRAGCIIRSRFLDDIEASFNRTPVPPTLLLDPFFIEELREAQPGWRHCTGLAIRQGLPVPALASALTFFDGYRCASGSANILQAQRDYFGSHGYQRVDRPGERLFHTRWSGDGREEELR